MRNEKRQDRIGFRPGGQGFRMGPVERPEGNAHREEDEAVDEGQDAET